MTFTDPPANIAVDEVSTETLLQTIQDLEVEKKELRRQLKDIPPVVDMIRIEGDEREYMLNKDNISSIELCDSDLVFSTTDNRPPIRVRFKNAKKAKKGFEHLQTHIYKHVFVVNPNDLD